MVLGYYLAPMPSPSATSVTAAAPPEDTEPRVTCSQLSFASKTGALVMAEPLALAVWKAKADENVVAEEPSVGANWMSPGTVVPREAFTTVTRWTLVPAGMTQNRRTSPVCTDADGVSVPL